jgi:hypothetical protein
MEIRKSTKESKKAGKAKKNIEPNDPIYISPNELVTRWCCSRSAVDRHCKAGRIRRFVLGKGENGSVRYLFCDIVRYEQERTV